MASEKENMQTLKTVGAAFFAVGLVCAELVFSGCGAPPEDEQEIGQAEQTMLVKNGGFGFRQAPGAPACGTNSAGQQCVIPFWYNKTASGAHVCHVGVAQGSSGGQTLTATNQADMDNAINRVIPKIQATLDANGINIHPIKWDDDVVAQQAGEVWIGWPGGQGGGNTIAGYVFPGANFPKSVPDAAGGSTYWSFVGSGGGQPDVNSGSEWYVDFVGLQARAGSGLSGAIAYSAYLDHVAALAILGGCLGIGSQTATTTSYSSQDLDNPRSKSITLTPHEVCLLKSVVFDGLNFFGVGINNC